ncbi:MAG: hypothetical protein FJ280_00635 [Planctomycetes bacterium]|nr:hypothetical protein [Planctomycetota bacterium]
MCRKMASVISLVLVLAVVLPSVATAQPAPAGWWRLDGNAEDSSRNNNHGTAMGNPEWVAGKFAGALKLDGVDDYVDCGNAPSLNITGDLTVTAWVYPTAGGHNTARILDKSSGVNLADPGYKFYLRVADNYIMSLSVGGTSQNTTARLVLNSWNYFAFVADGTQWKVLINDTWQQWNNTRRPNSVPNRLYLGSGSAAPRPFAGMLDDVRVYNAALTEAQVEQVKKGPLPVGAPSDPVPGHGAADVPRDVTLSWTVGKGSTAHDVYFGTSFADVNNASRTAPTGVLVSRGQSGNTYDTTLMFGTTYYWRVDGVGTGATIFKGQVWSFTAEPYAYPLQSVTATASSAQVGMGPENTVNGSGLDANGRHAAEPEGMWVSLNAPSHWIQYEFDRAYKLHELWVWNANQVVEPYVGFGAKDVTIEYSLDGITWTALAPVPQFARGPGSPGYAPNTTVSFGGVLARYVKLTITSTWGGIPQCSLSEVQFLSAPAQARAPAPADGAAGVRLDAVLSWRPGREAAAHTVYFGKDKDAVANGTAPAATVAAHRFTPVALEFGATYYWRADEVNEARTPGIHAGAVWSFRTQEYTVVEDFESYTDDEGSRIYEAWLDGYGTTTNGSQVGYIEAPFAEQRVVHGGKQSMPLLYDNTGSFTASEAKLAFSPAQDWTVGGVKTLSLWLYGDPQTTGAQLYVKVNGAKALYDGDRADLAVAGWRPWHIPLASFNTNLQKVTTLVIGVEGQGATGKFFFDDIRLYPRERLLVTPTEPDPTGLVAYYKFEKDGTDSSGQGHHGTVIGKPAWVAGKVGNAVQWDGRQDYLDCGDPPSLNLSGPTTIVGWLHPTGPGGGGFGRFLDKSSGTGATDPGYKFYHRSTENYIMTLSVGGGDRRSSTGLVLNAWNFLGFMATGTQWKLYLNGVWHEWEDTHLPTVVENPLYIGNGSAAERHFEGLMDEVRIYNRVLTLAEMAWLAGRTTPFDAPF